MRIKFLGAAGTVTGSSYILTSDSGSSILIDLGMFQGTPEISRLNYEPYDYDCSDLDGAVLTHAHLDHCGRLPIALSHGFKQSFWMTAATKDLTELSLLDSAKIARQERKPFLYDKNLALKTIAKFKTVDYHSQFQIGSFNIIMRDAGHILGSASLEIIDEKANGPFRKIIFSGDLGNTPEELVKATELIDTADAVVIESTYGDRLHPFGDPRQDIQREINSIEKSGGTLLIPAFSLDRTQEILHLIMHMKLSGKVLPQTPVYLDSPMAEKATLDYLKYSKLFNSHIQEDLKFEDPFSFPGLIEIKDWRESEDIHNQTGPKVIIAGSGMMTGGRIVGHAAYYLPMDTTRLFIVGYQGEETLGRELLEGDREIVIDRTRIRVNATISHTETMSSHADQAQLINWLTHIKNVRKVFITHGEDIPRSVLAEKITNDLKITDINLPTLNSEISF